MKKTFKGLLALLVCIVALSVSAFSIFAEEECLHLEVLDGVCSACQVEIVEPALDHEHIYEGVANCQGYWCDLCLSYYGEPDPDGHYFESYISTHEATCDLDAKESAECLHCDEVDVREIENTATHTFADATCVLPKVCLECGEHEGEELGHDFADATLNAPRTCVNCNETRGNPLVSVMGQEVHNDWFTILITAIIMTIGKIFGLA